MSLWTVRLSWNHSVSWAGSWSTTALDVLVAQIDGMMKRWQDNVQGMSCVLLMYIPEYWLLYMWSRIHCFTALTCWAWDCSFLMNLDFFHDGGDCSSSFGIVISDVWFKKGKVINLNCVQATHMFDSADDLGT